MHKLAEKIADCMKAKVEAKGIDNIEGQDLVELGMWTDIIKDLVCYDKDKKIIEAMDEAEESEEAMKYIEMYEDYPERKGYRGQRRDSRGRYMSNRGRRGYEHYMMPDMDWNEMEYQRDMDRPYGRMGYASGGSSMGSSQGQSSGGSSSSGMSSGSQGGNRGYSESRYDRARRGYEETKLMHNSGSAEDKQLTMKEAEKMINVIFDELEESLSDAPKEVKDMIKNKGMAKLQKMN